MHFTSPCCSQISRRASSPSSVRAPRARVPAHQSISRLCLRARWMRARQGRTSRSSPLRRLRFSQAADIDCVQTRVAMGREKKAKHTHTHTHTHTKIQINTHNQEQSKINDHTHLSFSRTSRRSAMRSPPPPSSLHCEWRLRRHNGAVCICVKMRADTRKICICT